MKIRPAKIGLALGSGAARGLAHIGVIKSLVKNEIPIDIIAGTSMGAVAGGLFAAGLGIDRIEDFAIEFGNRHFMSWIDPSFRSGGLIKGEKIEQALRDLTGPLTFDDLNIPFYAVATDFTTGTEVVIGEGDLHKAIRASLSIPGVFAPVNHEGSWLVDGALVEPVPTRVLHKKGCDVIISVEISTASRRKLPDQGERGAPGIIEVLLQSLFITQKRVTRTCTKLSSINLVPDVTDYRWTDFSYADELIIKGSDAANAAMQKIKKLTSRGSLTSLIGRRLGFTK